MEKDKKAKNENKQCWLREKCCNLLSKCKRSIEKEWNFKWEDLTSYERFVKLLYRPTDPASLGIARALFGLCMVIDVVEERGLADIDLKWGDTYACHFPLIHGMKPPTLPYMIVLYTVMWMGAFGIMLGFCFKLACACFVIPYWYIHILDKSFWNNHSYLYGLVALLFWGTGANRFYAIDAHLFEKSTTVPFWNYFILKFQFFALYFLAGLKKCSREWLEGYSMTNLSQHWVFLPFKLFLTPEQTDFFIVHWFGFIFDLTVGFWLLFDKTRIPAMVFCTAFHLMNSRLFSIGMFPYTCLATMGLFCKVDWPRKCLAFIDKKVIPEKQDEGQSKDDHSLKRNEKLTKKSSDEKVVEKSPQPPSKEKKPKKKQKFVVFLLLLHVVLQLFLPYSHFITKGYNNWVSGLYGYSWDMMVHNWDTILIVIRVRDNENNRDHFLDPQAWVPNEKWSKHGDMVIQYAQCVKNNLLRKRDEMKKLKKNGKEMPGADELLTLSSNLSIYVDVRCSLNGRFQQRVFDPKVDMLTVEWHPLKPVSFLMPLLNQYSSYRQRMEEITNEVYSWSNYTDVLFMADYPAMAMENYFCNEFANVTLTVLEGQVLFTEGNFTEIIKIDKGQSVPVTVEKIHRILTISSHPSSYMYIYTNQTKEQLAINGTPETPKKKTGCPIMKEITFKIKTWWRALGHIANAFFYLLYDVPMLRRVPKELDYYEYRY